MSEVVEAKETGTPPPAKSDGTGDKNVLDRLAIPGMARFSGIYLIIAMAVLFSIWLPDTFATSDNFRAIAASQAITGILTLGLVVSLISGVFDLSVAANMTLSISLVGVLQSEHGWNWVTASVFTVFVGASIGALNALIVTKLKVDPIIGTLGMSSVLAAVAFWLVEGRTIITGISPTFVDLGQRQVVGLPITVFYLAGFSLLLWYVLEHTPFGRYLYALGANPEATRLAGVRVEMLQWLALIISGSLAALAGVILTMSIGAASFGAGAPYLLPAFAAAFLGSTQIKPGRFNVAGTIVAIYLLAIGVKGLQLNWPEAGWIKSLFEGCALIFAVALAGRAERKRRT
jgi:ribose transport system permease protein